MSVNPVTFSCIILLITAISYWFLSKRKGQRKGLQCIPGPKPQNKRKDEDDIWAGLLPIYAAEQHERYGPIIKFKWSNMDIVSIASPHFFQQQSKLFNRPKSLFSFVEPLLGELSIEYANGEDGRKRHAGYAQFLSATNKFYPIFEENAAEIISELNLLTGKEFSDKSESLSWISRRITINNLASVVFGGTLSTGEIDEFARLNNWAWMPLKGQDQSISNETNHSKQGIARMQQLMNVALQRRKEMHIISTKEDAGCLLDVIMKLCPSSTEMQCSDGLTLIIGGLHAMKELLFWSLYHLAANKPIQDRVHEEINSALISLAHFDSRNLDKLPYLKQIVQEALRLSSLQTLVARFSEEEQHFDGYIIPPQTPVIQSLNVAMRDSKEFPFPYEFNPDNFSPDNVQKRHPYSFRPFGFAGNRVCPAAKFSLHATYVSVAVLLRDLDWEISPGQQSIQQSSAVVSPPDHDIHILVTPRDN